MNLFEHFNIQFVFCPVSKHFVYNEILNANEIDRHFRRLGKQYFVKFRHFIFYPGHKIKDFNIVRFFSNIKKKWFSKIEFFYMIDRCIIKP